MSDTGFASPVAIPRKNGEAASYGSDSALFATFYMERVHMTFESNKQGRPIYEDRPYIKIMINQKSDIIRPVRMVPQFGHPSDPERFPRQWAAFQNRQEQAQSGTPLEEWPPIPKNMIAEFKSCRVHTVEQLGAVHDASASQMPLEWRKWRDKARAWLETAKSNAPITALQSENERLKADMEALKQQMASLASGTETKRKPGRPSKVKPVSEEGVQS